jgi:hypothetical protein
VSAVDRVNLLRGLQPASDAAAEPVAGGYAVYCGPGAHLTQAVAVGLDGAATESDIDRLEDFYRQRNEPVRVEICPLAHPAFAEEFGKRGYRVTEFTNVMAQPLSPRSFARRVPVAGVTIEQIGIEQADLWGRTVADGFADDPPARLEFVEGMKLFVLSPRVQCYLARIDGEVSGGGALSSWKGVARLFGTSTLREFRGRGTQTALLQARLAQAAEAGNDVAMCLAQPGSTSQRNMVRQGFQTLYTRVKFEKDFGAR